MDFVSGEILLVNKPLHWTSFQAVNKIRYHIRNQTGVKKIKVGHAGTLDPLADGLLIICTGKKTKEIDSYMGLEKVYSGIITLGATTPSYDLETEIDQRYDLTGITDDLIKKTAAQMVGEQDQMPPIFSAKRVDGNRAYDMARAGKEVELKTKRITISNFEITEINLPEVHFKITCSKGTYIRSIAFDFGRLLNNGGHLSALRREAIGQFSLQNSQTVEEWVETIDKLRPINNSKD
ncbi:MAG: tRNA pseudouridine(55) synthase TruB [Crocinitomicaceae bacterium]|jgi:tRNA pseudouridine55 synthase|nr:tRNA pseudouridine(55) synthase TruB [Crocinitomicaceae bacterium]MBK6951447.1 tRNA pseudouridine(55) synthase TruB [Crocinitomicaceae bacterium]MBK9590337.1 tRNA pseudouridine(55) synthase TruB [Crocinitomicaceae bacterium]